MNKSIQKYIKDNFSVISRLLVIYTIGLSIGIAIFIFTDIKTEYINIVKQILDGIKLDNFESINVIINGLKNNMILILILYSCIITLIAPIIIAIILTLKAIITGIYICTLFSIFGIIKGIIVIFCSVFIPLIFSLLGYIFICTNIINIFLKINSSEKVDFKFIIKQLYWMIISFSLISFSLVVEQIMSNIVINIYSKM